VSPEEFRTRSWGEGPGQQKRRQHGKGHRRSKRLEERAVVFLQNNDCEKELEPLRKECAASHKVGIMSFRMCRGLR